MNKLVINEDILRQNGFVGYLEYVKNVQGENPYYDEDSEYYCKGTLKHQYDDVKDVLVYGDEEFFVIITDNGVGISTSIIEEETASDEGYTLRIPWFCFIKTIAQLKTALELCGMYELADKF